MEDLNQIIKRYENFPAMPNIIVKALAIIKNDNSGLKELSEIVSYDQAIATRILKLVNSAYYGLPFQITSITKGLALIGLVQGKNIIIATAMKPMLTTKDGKDLWRHSIRCAVACEHIANEQNIMNPSEAFALGFFHDIGKVVLSLYNPDFFNSVKEKVQNYGQDELELETRVFGKTHVEVGVALAHKWQLPVTLINSIKYHHNPLSSTMPQVAGLVYVGNNLCKEYDCELPTSEEILQKLNINVPNPEELKEVIMDKSTKLLNMLG